MEKKFPKMGRPRVRLLEDGSYLALVEGYVEMLGFGDASNKSKTIEQWKGIPRWNFRYVIRPIHNGKVCPPEMTPLIKISARTGSTWQFLGKLAQGSEFAEKPSEFLIGKLIRIPLKNRSHGAAWVVSQAEIASDEEASTLLADVPVWRWNQEDDNLDLIPHQSIRDRIEAVLIEPDEKVEPVVSISKVEETEQPKPIEKSHKPSLLPLPEGADPDAHF